MTRPDQNQIAVIGGGCAGAVTAWRLAAAGLDVTLLDRNREPGAEAACGGVMLHALRQRLELPAELVDGDITRLWIRAGSHRHRLDFARPIFVNFDRCRFDAYLVERAVAAGCRRLAGATAKGWDPATGELSWRQDGSLQRQAFGTVVFADGARSLARDHGIGIDGSTPTASAFYRELEADAGGTDEAEFLLDLPPDDPGYYWVFPKHGFVQVGVGRLHGLPKRPLRELVDQLIGSDPRLRDGARLRSRGGAIPFGLARRFARPGAMVVGDAAGLVNPITGGGLLYAVASAEMAAEAVIRADHGGWDAAATARWYQARVRRSVHYWWLRVLAHPFRFYHRRLEADRVTHFRSIFMVYARILPRLTPAARSITLRMADAAPAGPTAA